MCTENQPNVNDPAAAAPEPDPPPWDPPTFAPAPDLRAMMGEILDEESIAFEERLRHWQKLLDPRTDFEEFQVRIIVNLSFELERVIRAYEAELKAHVESTVDNELVNVHELTKQLFFDPATGSTSLYGLYPDPFNPKKTSSNGLPNDPLDPAVVLMKLTSTAAGCRHLREVWCDLRSRLDPGLFWQSPERLKCVRMCKLNPVDAAENERIARMYVASFSLERKDGHPDHAWTDLLSDMGKPALEEYRDRVKRRFPDLPSVHGRSRKYLIDLVDENIASLSAKVEMHDANTRAKAEQTVARLSFDESPKGERIRRSKTRCTSDFFKAISMYKKNRNKRDGLTGGIAKAESGADKAEPIDPNATSPAPSMPSAIEEIARIEQQIREWESAVASPSDSPDPVSHASARNDIPAQESFPHHPTTVANAPATAARPSNPFAGLSRREKRKALRAQRDRTPKRPVPPSPPSPPPTTIPSPKPPAIMNPGLSNPDIGVSPQSLRAQLEALNPTIQKLLETTPEAVEYLQMYLTSVPKTPAPPTPKPNPPNKSP